MSETEDENAEVHAEVEDLEQLGMSERKDADADDALHDAAEDWGTHCAKGLAGSVDSSLFVARGKSSGNVSAELHRYADRLKVPNDLYRT